MSLREEHYRVHPVLHYDVSSAEVVPLVVEPRDSGPGDGQARMRLRFTRCVAVTCFAVASKLDPLHGTRLGWTSCGEPPMTPRCTEGGGSQTAELQSSLPMADLLDQKTARALLEEHGWVLTRGGKHSVKMEMGYPAHATLRPLLLFCDIRERTRPVARDWRRSRRVPWSRKPGATSAGREGSAGC